jgi:hypothetical protein
MSASDNFVRRSHIDRLYNYVEEIRTGRYSLATRAPLIHNLLSRWFWEGGQLAGAGALEVVRLLESIDFVVPDNAEYRTWLGLAPAPQPGIPDSLNATDLALVKRHRDRLLESGRPFRGVRRATAKAERRTTHCYACKARLDNATDLQCTDCDWLLCRCGACGCGYLGYA